jgi:Family of unknown function (DUF6544)
VTRGARLAIGVPLVLLAVGAVALGALHGQDARDARAVERALAAPPAPGLFDPEALAALPDPARRYLAAALGAGTRPARSVQLRMEGRFRLGSDWIPLAATERLAADGFVWRADLTRGGTPIRVWDALGPGGATTRAWAMYLVPVARAHGPDLTRSAAGRLAAELVWLPGALLPGPGVWWEAVDADSARVHLEPAGRPVALTLRVDAEGRLTGVHLMRWGDPDGDGVFAEAPFGAEVTGHHTFSGQTIPTRLRAGWGYGTQAFTPFFEAEVTGADFSGGPG